ncbi:LPS export ABC transporter periplasmic protein LptC [Acidiferrobacter sp.]|uniref:LPS export ABC transporter periplasmic protein LptC n=1 Tax=Acidiferrobacter sp. TaxID=1872107 RepID=UPI002614375E|nr:LPS export ABC transporter periplasmic protein LptC [Acidiferrobacter sp.]
MGRWLSRFLLLTGFLLFSGLFWWLPEALVRPALTLAQAAPKRPDYYIDQATLTAMDRRGRPRFILTAQRLVHFSRGRRTLLIRPRLTQFGRHAITTTIARKGYVSPHGHVLTMRGHVRVFRGKTAQLGPTEVHTHTLTVHLTRS